MRHCRVCGGGGGSDFELECQKCGANIEQAVEEHYTPKMVPVAGYISLDEMLEIADAIRASMAQRQDIRRSKRAPIDMLSISMTMVKWLGATVICLVIAFFLVMILKAFVL